MVLMSMAGLGSLKRFLFSSAKDLLAFPQDNKISVVNKLAEGGNRGRLLYGLFLSYGFILLCPILYEKLNMIQICVHFLVIPNPHVQF